MKLPTKNEILSPVLNELIKLNIDCDVHVTAVADVVDSRIEIVFEDIVSLQYKKNNFFISNPNPERFQNFLINNNLKIKQIENLNQPLDLLLSQFFGYSFFYNKTFYMKRSIV